MQIARMYKRFNTPGTFYVLDTDATVRAMMMDDENRDLPIELRTSSKVNWEGIQSALMDFNKAAKAGDWVIVDMAPHVWKAAQNWYARVKYATDKPAEHALNTHASWTGKGDKSDIEGWNWQYVNGIYDEIMSPILYDSPAHVMCLAGAEELDPSKVKDKQKRVRYAGVNHVPKQIQNDLDYGLDTLIYLESIQGQTYATTVAERVKARGVDGVALKQTLISEANGFVFEYLLKVAGWKVVAG